MSSLVGSYSSPSLLFSARTRDDHGIHGLAAVLEADERIDINGLDKVRAGDCDLGD